MAEVRFSHVIKKYGKNEVVKDFSLTIFNEEFVTLVGPSGCGKSTILRMLAGLEEITEGDIYIDGIKTNDIPPQKRDVAMVFQSYALFPHMTVAENIAFGLKLRRKPQREIVSRIEESLALFSLRGLGERRPRDLSGGQRQRVALARALVLSPKVLLLDEPLSNLDAKLRLRMRSELKRIHRELRSTIFYVTHDQVEAMSLSDRVAVMNEGRLEQLGAPLEIYNSPKNTFVASFLGSPPINLLQARIQKEGETLYVNIGPCKLALSRQFRESYLHCAGRDIIFGIRPEHISIGESGKGKPILATVDVVEPLGDRSIITVALHKIELALITDAQTISPLRTIPIIFDMEKAQFFDRESGENIICKNR
ncbi:MAG: ABC transporter ATP-binding protein [Syntrophales bacterium]|nr:ABC transporter ATP-binding protein [Syntrophales bacterium]MDY0044639.1 ABC transporter ATP-binding protein [Syntrophales bacterium]